MEGRNDLLKKISTKIWAGFISIILLMSVIVGFTYYQIGQLVEQTVRLSELDIPLTNASQELAFNYVRQASGVRGYLATGNEIFLQEYQDAQKKANEHLAYLDKQIVSKEQRELFDQVKQALGEFEQYPPVVFSLYETEGPEYAATYMQISGTPANDRAIEAIKKFTAYQEQQMQRDGNIIKDQETHISRILLIMLLLGLLLGMGLAYFIAKPITRALEKVNQVSSRYAQGDFSEGIEIKSADELGQLAKALNKMQQAFKEIILKLQGSSVHLNQSAKQLTAQAQQTSAGSAETAATVVEIASTMEQVTNNAQEVAALSEKVSREAEAGFRGVKQITGQMELISSSSGDASRVVEELTNTLNRVNQIVDLITNIADQTNLLALNAAIEAARAGDHGRGFAVVAEEVRKLAEQSAEAAKDINLLISQVQVESQKAVEAMGEGNKQVQEGNTVVEEVGIHFNGIIRSVEGLAGQIQNVASASQQVSAGVQNVSATAEEQTAAMEEVASATEQLNKMADDLNEVVDKFKV